MEDESPKTKDDPKTKKAKREARTALLAHLIKEAMDDLLLGPLAPMLTATAGALDYCLHERYKEFAAYMIEQVGEEAAKPIIDPETLTAAAWLAGNEATDAIMADARTRGRELRANADKN